MIWFVSFMTAESDPGSINQESDSLVKQLQDKIKSKMDVAKFFAGFISLVLGIVPGGIVNLIADSSIAFTGFLFLLFSLSMSIATLFAYDRLLMPPKLWYKPLSDDYYKKDVEILKEDMIHAWNRFFIPSVVALLGGLICLLVTVTKVGTLGIIVFLAVCSLPLFLYMVIPIKSHISK